MSKYILAIDQGTTSSRAIVFNENYKLCGVAQQEIEQIFPRSGWVEHNPNEILSSCIETARLAIKKSKIKSSDIAAIGITNQRETTIIWDKKTGKPVYNAIVWQDRRTAEICNTLKDNGHEALFTEKTGLLLDPYFSGTKIQWILDNVEGARTKANQGDLLFGTVDSWLLWNLTKAKIHASDASNASRTLLFDIKKQQWDDELLNILNIPSQILPHVLDCAADFGVCFSGGRYAPDLNEFSPNPSNTSLVPNNLFVTQFGGNVTHGIGESFMNLFGSVATDGPQGCFPDRIQILSNSTSNGINFTNEQVTGIDGAGFQSIVTVPVFDTYENRWVIRRLPPSTICPFGAAHNPALDTADTPFNLGVF